MDMELTVPSGWTSWSALKGRRRHPVRLSASVDSIPYADNDFFSSVGSLNYYNPELEEEDGSVNNILDALGNGSASAATLSTFDFPPDPTAMAVQLSRPDGGSAGDNDSSGLGSASGSGSGSAGGASGPPTNSSASPTGSAIPQNEEYEHVYCQLDPFFNPPLNKSQSGQNGRFATRASVRSWGRTAGTMDRDPGIIPFLQQALAVRYREMLETYLTPPPWFRQHMGSAELDEICPVVFQVVQPMDKTYGSMGSIRRPVVHRRDNYKPILPHQIFAKTGEEDMTRTFWLEGEPGSGKTLLCLKLVQEWVAYHSYSYSQTNTRLGEFQVLFYVPLREVKGSLSRFLVRELIPKRSILSRMKPANVWKCLNLLGNSMLLILDGLDDVQDEELLKEIEDILNGQMFPQCLVLVTATPSSRLSSAINRIGGTMPVMRKFVVSGMDWTQIQVCIRRYFTGRKFGNETRMAEILSDRPDLCALSSNPYMCLLLCAVFEEVGDVPCSNAELYECLLRSLIYQNGLIRAESTMTKDNSIPPKWRKVLEDFGKLVLSKLSDRRVTYTEQEVNDQCGSLDVIKCGILSRSRTFFRSKSSSSVRTKSTTPLVLLHPSLNPFLAAYYLTTTVAYPNILRRELDLLPGIEAMQESQVQITTAFSVTQHLMELLNKRSASVFSTLTLLDISLNYLLALLRAAGFYESNLNAVCGIMRSLKHVTINVASDWVSEWKQVISSTHCPFESAEIVIRPGYSMSRLIEGLCVNESIHSIKFASVPGQEWSAVEVNLICGQMLKLLSEKRIQTLEISMTCLEDKEHTRFQPVVDALCYVLSKGTPLKKLVLDMDLTSAQVLQLVSFIKVHEPLQVLHLPHLGCGPEGFRAISDLLRDKPLVSLSLAGTWRSTSCDDEDMDVVVEPIPPLVSPLFEVRPKGPFSATGPFSSLPRPPVNGSIKSPSIRRRKAHLTQSDKRNSDSVLFQRNFLPLPICDKENHEVDGFHGIFSVLRSSPGATLKSLNLSKCVMNWEDVICLGETVRKTTTLDSLRMEGMKLCDVLPVLLGLQENTSLKMLDLSSPHVVIGDDAIQLVASSLAKNKTLKLLSLQGWTMYIEEDRSLDAVESLFRSSAVQDLDVSGLRIHVSLGGKSPTKNDNKERGHQTLEKDKKTSTLSKKPSMNSLVTNSLAPFGTKKVAADLSFLRMGGMTVEVRKGQVWRSPDVLANLLPFVDKGKVTHLDISLDKNDSLHSVDEKTVVRTLKIVAQNFPRLQTLVMTYWRMKMTEKGCKDAAKALVHLDTLSGLTLDNCTVTEPSDNPGGRMAAPVKRLDHALSHALLTMLKGLTDFSWANFESSHVTLMGRTLCDLRSVTIRPLTLRLEGVPLPALKVLLSVSSRTSNGLSIEYVGNNTMSIQPKGKEKEHRFKLRRFL